MTATDELRRLLDERGVEYVLDHEYAEKYPPEQAVTWSSDIAGEDMTVTARDYFIGDGEYCLDLEFHEVFTPAQAIAATLGSCNCSNSERTEACLPHFWTHDGVLHIELPKLPESISVRLPDQRDREVRSARTWQYTRGSGTYQKVYLVETSDDLIESWYPIGVYLNSKVAGDCAEALRGEVDGIQQFARVVELKVVDDG